VELRLVMGLAAYLQSSVRSIGREKPNILAMLAVAPAAIEPAIAKGPMTGTDLSMERELEKAVAIPLMVDLPSAESFCS
jgi:hypothetical protein